MPDVGGIGLQVRARPATSFHGSRLHRLAGVFANFAVATSSGGQFVSDPWQLGIYTNWAASLPPALVSALGTAGFTGIRFVLDPGPLIEAVASRGGVGGARWTYLLAQVTAAIDVIMATPGLAVIVDLHVRPDPAQAAGYSDRDIVTAYPGGSAWTTYVATAAALAAVLGARYPAGRVCFEMFNEPPFGSYPASWERTMAPALWGAIRAAAPGITILVAGSNDAAVGVNTAIPGCFDQAGQAQYGTVYLDPTMFDANTMFVGHSYVPLIFAFQGLGGGGEMRNGASVGTCGYVDGLEYPPDPSRFAANLARYTAAVNADSTLTPAQKADTVQDVTWELRLYYGKDYQTGADTGVPKNGAWMIGDNSASSLKRLAAWADSYGVRRNRVILGEFGADDGTDANGSTTYLHLAACSPASKAAYLRDKRAAAEFYGFSWSVWDLCSRLAGLRITDATQVLVPAFAAALIP